MDLYIVLGSAIVGLLVGATGAGGGALMTPMLILLFSVKPSAAIASDLVAAVVMRPFGAAVHLKRRSVNMRVVGWMCLGSVPAAFAGAYLLHLMGKTAAAQQHIEVALGIALLFGAGAMAVRFVLDRRAGAERRGVVRDVPARPLLTLAVGIVGGLMVGATSVGAGSLMVVLLMFVYPSLSANQLVGTDLTQALPLTAAAALGALAFGHVDFGVTTSIVAGAVPAVIVGSLFSSRVPDRYVRPVIGFVILASGLKYVGLPVKALGYVMASLVLVAVVAVLAKVRPTPRRRLVPAAAALTDVGDRRPAPVRSNVSA
jgi:uncharacterized membrane protein YfcA